MPVNFDFWPLLLFYSALFTAFYLCSRFFKFRRLTVVFGCLGLGVYFYWRITYTIVPYSNAEDFKTYWMWAYLIFEFLSISDLFQHYTFEVFREQRQHTLDEQRQSQTIQPRVDLLLPTYDEPIEILRKTFLCAKEIDWENLTINVLDDGRRSEVEQLAQSLGLRYFARSSNEGAKAGNMNHALPHLDGEFVAILDADFMAFRHFIKSAMPVFDDKKIACVQFPQTFYNPDPTQQNSNLFRNLKDEQWLWYHEVLPARDRVNLATSCGSCSIVRRSALKLLGDRFPEDTITEDFDLSLRFLDQGLITRYIDQPVAIGLHAQSVKDFFKQRKRWALGNIKAFSISISHVGELSPLRKILLFEWRAISLPARIVTFFAPAGVFLLDIWPLRVASLLEYLVFTIPFILIVAEHELRAATISMRDVYLHQSRTVGLAIAMTNELLKGFLASNETKFETTQKTARQNIQEDNPFQKIFLFCVIISIASLTVGGIKFWFGPPELSTDVSLFWQAINLALIIAAFKMFSDVDVLRKSERFIPILQKKCELFSMGNKFQYEGLILDISETGLKIELPCDIEPKQKFIQFDGLCLHSKHVNSQQTQKGTWEHKFAFVQDDAVSANLIVKIYTGEFTPEILRAEL